MEEDNKPRLRVGIVAIWPGSSMPLSASASACSRHFLSRGCGCHTLGICGTHYSSLHHLFKLYLSTRPAPLPTRLILSTCRPDQRQGAFRSRQAEEMNRIPIFGSDCPSTSFIVNPPICTQPLIVTMSRAPMRSHLDMTWIPAIPFMNHAICCYLSPETLRNILVPHPTLL